MTLSLFVCEIGITRSTPPRGVSGGTNLKATVVGAYLEFASAGGVMVPRVYQAL